MASEAATDRKGQAPDTLQRENDQLREEVQHLQAEAKASERAMRDLREEFERRVERRTAELRTANRILEQQMADRREAEAQLYFMADAIPQMVWSTRADGYHDYFNRRWYEYTGLPAGAAHGWAWADVLHPDDYRRTVERWQRALETGEPYETEVRLRRHDGAYRWQLARALPRRDADGTIVQWVGTCTDIHDQRLAQDALRRREQELQELNETLEVRVEERTAELSEANAQLRQAQAALSLAHSRLRGIIDGTTDLVAAVDQDYSLIVFNEAYARSFEAFVGYRPYVGLDVLEATVHNPHYYEQTRSRWGRALKGEPYRIVQEVHPPDGSQHFFEIHYSPIRDDEGQLVGASSVMRDVTERQLAEEAVRRSEAHFREALRYVPVTLARLDRDMRFEWVHNTHPDFDGEVLLGRRFEEVFPSPSSDLLNAMLQEAFGSGRSVRRELAFRLSDGVRTYDLTVTPLYSSTGEIVGLTSAAFDITDRKRAEAELERSRRALEQANRSLVRSNRELEQRNRELQDFAYVASHDLQEPLRKVQTFAGLFREDFGSRLDETALSYIERIESAASRMSELIRDLLAFSRVMTRGRPFQETDLNEIVTGVLQDLEVAIMETGAHIEAERLAVVEADATQARQLFQNLISNALKFRREDVIPRVQITGDVVEEEGRPVCRIVVQDNGIGFKQEYAEKIFTPFQRLHGHSAFDGTGMGLAICRRILERHGGTITAESEPGEGTSFTILLPVRQSDRPAAPAQ